MTDIPSISAPSWLFHEITSDVPRFQSFTCAVMSVSLLARKGATDETYSSLMCAPSASVNAIVLKSFVNETPPMKNVSGAVMRRISVDCGLRRNACDVRVLQRHEVDSVGPPIERTRIFIEFCG